MIKEGLNSEPKKELLNIMLNNPRIYYQYKDFQLALHHMGETSIRTHLRKLVRKGILEESQPRGKP